MPIDRMSTTDTKSAVAFDSQKTNSCWSFRPHAGFKLWLLGMMLVSSMFGCGTTNGYLMNRSGKRYYDKGNYEFARYEFERALMDDPHNAGYAFNVARTMEREGELENAELMYQHALTIDPSHQPSYHGLASMLREQGRNEEAGQLLTAWADTQPYHSGAQMSAAGLAASQGDQARADWYYQQAMDTQPMNRRQQRMAQQRRPYPQMVAGNQMMGQSSSAYPYSAPPSVQMANVMPQNDFTMMGGPVVADNQNRMPTSYGQTSLPVNQGFAPQPQQQIQLGPTQPLPAPNLIPESANANWSAPQGTVPQQASAQPQNFGPATSNLHETSFSVPQPPIQQTAHPAPVGMTVPSAVQVVPAVQAF